MSKECIHFFGPLCSMNWFFDFKQWLLFSIGCSFFCYFGGGGGVYKFVTPFLKRVGEIFVTECDEGWEGD